MPKLIVIFGLALTLSTAQAQSDSPGSVEELWEIIQQQQKRIEQLEAGSQATTEKLESTETIAQETAAQVAATTDFVESLETSSNIGDNWFDRTQIGGYGELHYNNLSARDAEFDTKEIDFHRFVLFVNHQFNDRLRFVSELELEHSLAGEGKNGEVELEQAYIQYDFNDQYSVQGGLFLMPIGILNETHEPTTFYGVERNSIENIIVPTTWWEAGALTGGRYANGVSWDIAVTSGLAMETTGSSAFRVRSGRQKVSEALANDLAYTARIKYTGIPGLELAASAQLQEDASQVANDGLDEGLLLETHAVYQKGGFGLRGLYARWDFDGFAVEAADADKQTGWYLEPSYRWSLGGYELGAYARYEDVEGGRTRDRFDQWEIGLNYWPADNVVLKFDYRDRSHDLTAEQGRDFDGFDLGIGYVF